MNKSKAWTAETIAIGSELLLGGRMDTNSLFIADRLAACGVELRYKSIVGDELSDIVAVLKTAARRARVVIVTGGLGPTIDDLTREAVAQATGQRLSRRKTALDGMVARLAEWGRTPTKAQLRQAMIPAGADILSNPVGTAPGFAVIWKDTFLAALPGVPREMEPMIHNGVLPRLQAWIGKHKGIPATPVIRRVLHTSGVPESLVDQRLEGLLPEGTAIQLGIYASPMEVMVSLTGPDKESGPVTIDRLFEEAKTRLGDIMYGEGDDTMESVVGRLLTDRHMTLAVAESCTGGLIGHRLTQVPGSSSYVDRGIVSYSNRAKIDLLGVPSELIDRHGAVSAEVAAAMARGIRERSGVSVGLSVTGIAGPGGATKTKPVGLVYLGLDGGPNDAMTKECRFHGGDRSVIKQRSAQAALDLLRRWLLKKGGG
ncbi:MAG TPA: competence/damage-inducible protein A [Nitrospira sp.]|nr:competence/damage-inducible protein A [Nitrospira sp. NTP1]HQR13731.1 competence/damage-inducible protein A [Nitrospira sp.]HQV10474.1 competence/damage-inducible protein A [Nitrospira sp.]